VRLVLKTRIAALLALPLLTLVLIPSGARAQSSAPAQAAAQSTPAQPTASTEQMDEPETHAQIEAFRHSEVVQAIARRAGLSTKTAAEIFQDVNSGLLILGILWFVIRVVPKMFRKRNETLQKQLLDARLAAAEANQRLAAVEERLSKLGVEIEAIREQTERDSVNDEKRIQESLEAERQRIVASAEQEIDLASAAAQRELKKFAAELAVDRARREIRLSADADRTLIRAFGESLKGDRN
jgi:F-type H+-transporting ATPase subunit b